MVWNIYVWQWKTQTQPKVFTALFSLPPRSGAVGYWLNKISKWYSGEALKKGGGGAGGVRLAYMMYFPMTTDRFLYLKPDSGRLSVALQQPVIRPVLNLAEERT